MNLFIALGKIQKKQISNKFQLKTLRKTNVLERANISYALVDGKVFQSVNWIVFFYAKLYCDNRINLDDKGGEYFEQIRLRGFNFEAQKEKKLVCTTFGFFNRLTKEEKKAAEIVSNA